MADSTATAPVGLVSGLNAIYSPSIRVCTVAKRQPSGALCEVVNRVLHRLDLNAKLLCYLARIPATRVTVVAEPSIKGPGVSGLTQNPLYMVQEWTFVPSIGLYPSYIAGEVLGNREPSSPSIRVRTASIPSPPWV